MTPFAESEDRSTGDVLRLYAEAPPSGRCLMLGVAIHKVAAMSGQDAILAAQGLFASLYTRERPLTIEVADPSALNTLVEVCREFNVLIDMPARPS